MKNLNNKLSSMGMFRKITAICICFAMVFTLSLIGFAEDNGTPEDGTDAEIAKASAKDSNTEVNPDEKIITESDANNSLGKIADANDPDKTQDFNNEDEKRAEENSDSNTKEQAGPNQSLNVAETMIEKNSPANNEKANTNSEDDAKLSKGAEKDYTTLTIENDTVGYQSVKIPKKHAMVVRVEIAGKEVVRLKIKNGDSKKIKLKKGTKVTLKPVRTIGIESSYYGYQDIEAKGQEVKISNFYKYKAYFHRTVF